MQTIQNRAQFPKLTSIPEQVLSGRMTFKDLSLINEVIPVLSQTGLRRLEDNFDVFLEAIRVKAQQADVTWQACLRSFLFYPEAVRIGAFLKNEGADAPFEKRREVRLAIQMNECQFDCSTVSDYLREEKKTSALAHDPDDNFQHFIRMKSRNRVEEHYKSMFEELIDLVKVATDERHLHPGFEKVCGLKGSKLSGG